MKKTKELAFGSMIMAIILLMALVPNLGYLQINVAVTITLIHIPVLIGAMTFRDRNLAIIAGTTFGVSSWFVAMTRPTALTDVVFQNPIVSILPRILFALLAYYLYKVLSEKLKKDDLAKIISIVIATLFHTVLVLTLLYIFGQSYFEDGLIKLLVGVISVNGWIEIAVAAIIVPPIIKVLQKAIQI